MHDKYYSGNIDFKQANPLLMIKSDENQGHCDALLWWHVLTIDTRLHRGCIIIEQRNCIE